MKKLIYVSAIAMGLMALPVHAAGDAAAGKTKSATCAGCHGANGVSGNDMWPNLAGQKAGYLMKQIKAFKAGTRQDPLMGAMAAGLSDQDIEDLAAYYSSGAK